MQEFSQQDRQKAMCGFRQAGRRLQSGSLGCRLIQNDRGGEHSLKWCTKYSQGEVITEKTFRKERHRLQAKHLWMEVKLSWNVLSDRIYTVATTGKSREQLYELLLQRVYQLAVLLA